MNRKLIHLISECLEAETYASPKDIKLWMGKNNNNKWSIPQIETELHHPKSPFYLVAAISMNDAGKKDQETVWGLI